jgi:NAD(P)-dependent dehydrogenase (short-subunit alcohol dehydrogenase family)
MRLTGAYLAAQEAARRMVQRGEGGRIVKVTSVHEHVPKSGSSVEQRDAIPLGRPGDAREIGVVVAFLCSPQASYATGASFVVDGGMLLTAAEANALVESGDLG